MGKHKINRVIFLGAGFSSPAGIPSQRDLISKILTLQKVDLGEELDLVRLFLKFLWKDEDLLKIIRPQDVYTVLDRSITENCHVGVFDVPTLIRVRRSLDKLILNAVGAEIPEDKISAYSEWLKEYVTESTCFVSLNWDLLLERVLRKLNFAWNYGIEIEDYDRLKTEQDVLVLKPHGSLSWLCCPICRKVYASMDHVVNECECVALLKQANEDVISDLRARSIDPAFELSPLFITPSFLKDTTFPELREIQRNLYECVTTAEEIIFWGYRLPTEDHEIRGLIVKANAVNKAAKIHVVITKSRDGEKKDIETKENYYSLYGERRVSFDFTGCLPAKIS